MNDEKRFGVALVKETCPICGEPQDGPIIMGTRASKKQAEEIESLNGKVVSMRKEPCDNCKELMKKGFILIGIVGACSDPNEPDNPYRSGNLWVIRKEAAKEIINSEKILKKGVAFIDVKLAEQFGLPNVNLDA